MPQVALTDRFAAAAKSMNAPQTDYFDAGTKGLALRVAQGGRKTWTFHFTCPSDGKRSRMTLGTYPATSLASARTKALEAKSQVEAGNDPRAVTAAQGAAATTVTGLINSYLEKHARPSLRTADAIERRLNKNVVPVIGTLPLSELHRRDLNRVIDPIMARRCPVEANRVFEDFRAALRWAVARGDLDHNPVYGMSKPSASRPRERVLSNEEIRTLWNGLPIALARSKSCQLIIKLCLVTAQRVGEVAGMRLDELDLRAGVWSLPGSRTKNGNAHRVPLSGLAGETIEEAMADVDADSAFVFPCAADALSPHAVARTIGRAQETTADCPLGRFGIPHWTAHDLRRTALTNFAPLGIPPIVAGAVANHLSVTKATVTLKVYQQYTYEAEKRQALDLWADRLEAIINGKGAHVLTMKTSA